MMCSIVFSIVTAIALCACGGKGVGPEPEPEPKANHEEGDLVIELPGGVKMAFMWIEPGTFMMGMPEGVGVDGSDPRNWNRSRPNHLVTISKGFYLGKYEVTQKQWLSLMDTAPWGNLKGIGDDYPVANMSLRDDTVSFIDRLNEHFQTAKFRLPTEAEWEYACRAGTSTLWSFGDDIQLVQDYAWFNWNSDGQAHPVGQKLPNPWGLYDMHGNVDEGVLDGERSYTTEPQIDPVGPPPVRIDSLNIIYIFRGGSWSNLYSSTISARRGFNGSSRGTHVGFRILREGPKEP